MLDKELKFDRYETKNIGFRLFKSKVKAYKKLFVKKGLLEKIFGLM